MTTNGFDPLDEELTAAARTLHEEWDSPRLWPSIASQLAPPKRSWRWQAVAAAAVVVLALGSSVWFVWHSRPRGEVSSGAPAEQRLLSDVALAEIERSEAQYVSAIDELTRITAPKLDMPASPLLVNLRERLTVIDGAIDEYRREIGANRFNGDLRRQLLSIYQVKRRTLEAVQEYDDNAL
jgi:hypothetical protein